MRYAQILPNLFISDYTTAINKKFLYTKSIKNVITVNSEPLEICKVIFKKYLFIESFDTEYEDLLSNFDITNKFIEDCLNYNEAILIHCQSGLSRSATILLAYLLKSKKKSLQDTLSMVKSIYSIEPNKGFIKQLQLYEEMGYFIDLNNKSFRIHLLSSLGYKIRNNAYLADSSRIELIKYWKKLDEVKGQVNSIYKCKKCRYTLLTDNNVLNEEIEKIFVEPIEWMNILASSGNLYCPKCKCKIGSFQWNNGNSETRFPQFKLIISRIDCHKIN